MRLTSNAKMEVTATVELTGDELLMLEHLAGYDMATVICNHVTSRFSHADWTKLFRGLKDQTTPVVSAMRTAQQAYAEAIK